LSPSPSAFGVIASEQASSKGIVDDPTTHRKICEDRIGLGIETADTTG